MELISMQQQLKNHLASEGIDALQLECLRERYQLGRRLGKGTYGTVRLARDRCNKQLVALKRIYKRNLKSTTDVERVKNEIDIMRSLNHPNIIKLLDVVETDSCITLVMEYAAGGELFEKLLENKLEACDTRRLFYQVATAVNHCHEIGIVHRDIKLENILLDSDNNVKLADFGLASRYSEAEKLTTFCGSALYASPEVINSMPYVGPELDCWSLGVLMFTLVHGCMPFGGNDLTLLRAQITTGRYWEPQYNQQVSPLITSLLNPDSTKRANVSSILKSSWLKDMDITCDSHTLCGDSLRDKADTDVKLCRSVDSGVDLDSRRSSTSSNDYYSESDSCSSTESLPASRKLCELNLPSFPAKFSIMTPVVQV